MLHNHRIYFEINQPRKCVKIRERFDRINVNIQFTPALKICMSHFNTDIIFELKGVSGEIKGGTYSILLGKLSFSLTPRIIV